MYWVQVGAFRDPHAAQSLAQKLREQKFPVQESVTPPASGPERAPSRPAASPGDERDRYEVLVTGGAPGEMEATLTAKGLKAGGRGGTARTPSLSLGEAVALSKALSGDGLAVLVRRADSASTTGPRSRPGPGGAALYRVRSAASAIARPPRRR